jgi:hypothetical protein
VEVEERDGVGNLSGWGFGDVVLSDGAQLDECRGRWVPAPLPLISLVLFPGRLSLPPFLPSSLPPFFARSLLPTALTPARPLLQAACVRLRGIRAHMRERGV